MNDPDLVSVFGACARCKADLDGASGTLTLHDTRAGTLTLQLHCWMCASVYTKGSLTK